MMNVRCNLMRKPGMGDEMVALFDQFFGVDRAAEGTRFVSWSPPVDIVEENGNYEITADLPGLRKEDIRIEIDDDMLTLKGEKKIETERKDAKYRMAERRYGEFERRFTLPENANRDEIHAEFKDGVLKLTIPKTEPAKAKQIEVKVE